MLKKNRLSITVLGVFASLIVVGLLLFESGTSIRRQYHVYSASRDAEAAARLLGTFSKALLPMTSERSLTQVSLSLSSPAPDRFRAMIKEQRDLYAIAFDEIEKIAKASTIPSVGRFWSEISAIKAELIETRKSIDSDMSKPAAERQVASSNHGARIIGLIDRAMDAGNILRDKETLDAAGVTTLDTLQSRASSIREYGGRGRTQFAIAALNQTPINASTIGYMRENHGRVLQAWQFMLANRDNIQPNVRAAIEEVKKSYFEDYNEVRISMYAAADTGRYPLDFAAFFERSGKALAATEKLVLLLNDEMVKASVASQDLSKQALIGEVTMSLLIVASILFLIWLLVIRVVSRINRLNAMMVRLAGGNTNIDTSVVHANDEIGDMVQAVEVFRANILRLDELKEDERQRESTVARERALAMNEVADKFAASVGAIVNDVAGAAQTLEIAAKGLSANAGSTDERSKDVAAAAMTASRNVEFVAGAAGQLSSSVNEISSQVAHSSSISAQAVSEASTTAEEFRKLSAVTDQIGSIAAMISDIAARTNLLALNATIEAARAGDAGKGFAVVASEVKLLAEQTGRATQEIGMQIQAIKVSASSNVAAINNIQDTISKMHSIASSVASAVEEQSAATQEIATSISEANDGVRAVSSNIASVQESAALSSNEAEQVLQAARKLSSQAGAMRSEIEGFITSIREAA
jgi:methyl-accepting chemotaxis protein